MIHLNKICILFIVVISHACNVHSQEHKNEDYEEMKNVFWEINNFKLRKESEPALDSIILKCEDFKIKIIESVLSTSGKVSVKIKADNLRNYFLNKYNIKIEVEVMSYEVDDVSDVRTRVFYKCLATE